jgi:pteridine reductase
MTGASPPVALVTGAARRVGAVIARTLHAAGYDLALHCRHSRAQLDALIGELESARPRSTLALQADLADSGRLPGLVDATVARFGRLDALVNNASAFYATPLGTIAPEQWEQLFAANARAPLFLAQAAAPQLRATRGCIVNLSDFYAAHPQSDAIPYAASKAALEAITRGLARALAPEVRVNAVSPGAICWPEAGLPEREKSAMLARTLLRRVGSPGELAETVRWLVQDASFMTGETIRVDGGRETGG